jgi:hypothetical protein
MNPTVGLRCRAAGLLSMRRRGSTALPAMGSWAVSMVREPGELPMRSGADVLRAGSPVRQEIRAAARAKFP